MVTDISVHPFYDESDVHVSVSAELSLGNVMLPSVSIPIPMPGSGEEIGSVQMQSGLGGQSTLNLDVNLSKVAKIQANYVTLPNGNLLPLIGNNKVIVIPIKNAVNLYLTLGDGVAAVGVDIPFKTLDSVGSGIGSVSLFPTFNIKGIIGAAGLYFSKEAGKNGFGLFADISSVLEQAMFLDLKSQKDQSMDMSFAKSFGEDNVRLNYASISPSKGTKKKIDDALYKLHKKRKTLQLH